MRLGLAARQLHRGDGLVRDAKSKAVPGGLAVDVEIRGAVARRGAERVLGGAALHLRDPAASSRISAANPRAQSATVLGMACCMWV